MTIRDRWKKASLPNQLLVIVGGTACFFSALYTVAFFCQAWLIYESGQQAADRTDRILDNLHWLAADMDGALKEAQRAREASERQSEAALDVSINASMNTLRPYVYVSKSTMIGPVGERQPMKGQGEVINGGRTPATKVRVWSDLTVLENTVSLGDNFPCPSPRNPKGTGSPFGSTAELGPNGLPFTFESPSTTVTPDMPGVFMALLKSGGFKIYFYGDISYSELLRPNTLHHTQFCGVYNPGTGTFDVCEHHTNAD